MQYCAYRRTFWALRIHKKNQLGRYGVETGGFPADMSDMPQYYMRNNPGISGQNIIKNLIK